MEIEPKYVAVALQRMADMGLTPERLSDGARRVGIEDAVSL
jgi:hypothetical protein